MLKFAMTLFVVSALLGCKLESSNSNATPLVKLKPGDDPCAHFKRLTDIRKLSSVSPEEASAWLIHRFDEDPNFPLSPTMKYTGQLDGSHGGKRLIWKRRHNDWNPVRSEDNEMSCLGLLLSEPLENPFWIIDTLGSDASRVLGFEFRNAGQAGITPDVRELAGAIEMFGRDGIFAPISVADADNGFVTDRAKQLSQSHPRLLADKNFAFNYSYVQRLADETKPALSIASKGVLYQHDLTFHALSFLLPDDLLKIALIRIRLVYKVVQELEKSLQKNWKPIVFLVQAYARGFDIGEGNSLAYIKESYKSFYTSFKSTPRPVYSAKLWLDEFVQANILSMYHPNTKRWLRSIVSIKMQFAELVNNYDLIGPQGARSINQAVRATIENESALVLQADRLSERLLQGRGSHIDILKRRLDDKLTEVKEILEGVD